MMASHMMWKPSPAQQDGARSPSPPPPHSIEWFLSDDIYAAESAHNERALARKRRRHDGARHNSYISHATQIGPNGAMDALSSVALEFGPRSPYSHRHSASAFTDERPNKRVRSERYHLASNSRDNSGYLTFDGRDTGGRPTTSYTRPTPNLAERSAMPDPQDDRSTMQDAQLLLEFFQNATRIAPAVPTSPTKPAKHSPSHTRSVSFGQSPTFINQPSYQTSHEPLAQYQSPHTASTIGGAQVQFQGLPLEQPRYGSAPAKEEVNDTERTGNAHDDFHSTHAAGSMPPPPMDRQKELSNMHTSPAPPTISGSGQHQQPEMTPKGAHSAAIAEDETQRNADEGLRDGTISLQDSIPSEQVVNELPLKHDDAATAMPPPSGAISAFLRPDNDDVVIQFQQHADEAKKRDAKEQICGACGFNRNKLTLETEDESTSWISCDGCNQWFHFACAGFKSERAVRSVDKYRCSVCKPLYGPTTFVRKSSRAHAAIDYAELNQGNVKTSEESPEHHYIKPIKEGTIKFTPETFARIRPELITEDFWLRGDGMREPVVIPADWNPQPRRVPRPEDAGEESLEDPAAGELIHDQSALESDIAENFEYSQEPDEGQDALDMVIPRDLTVRRVAELYGPEEKLEVIDVKSQNGEDKRWNMRKWADYYESDTPNKPVRNVISLEVSHSKLGRLIRRPKVVRDLDLQDSIWPQELIARGDYPKVQFYCLMSVADCYTDFHIDFGGSSVYYHIIKGKKTFFFIPPTETNLKKYEDWCNSASQNQTFLGDQTKVCYRVDLGPGDTMLIPAGWIHAVWTPEDSLVIGGNFLTRQNYPMQIRITQIEKATGVARKFRYPSFQKVMWYTVIKYLSEDPIPQSVMDMLLSGQKFERTVQTWEDYDAWGEAAHSGPETEQYHTRYYPKCELEGLPELARYIQRTAYIAAGYVTDGVSSDTKRAVQRSIPKEYKQHGSEPVDCVRKFAMWYCWKRGNELLPHWAYPDYVPESNAPEVTQKKLSAAHIRRLEREAAMSAERVSDRPQRERKQPSNLYNEMMTEQEKATQVKPTRATSPTADSPLDKALEKAPIVDIAALPTETPIIKKETQPKKRKSSGGAVNRQPACEACRKGRRACKHRDLPTTDANIASSSQFGDAMDGVESSPSVFANGNFVPSQMPDAPHQFASQDTSFSDMNIDPALLPPVTTPVTTSVKDPGSASSNAAGRSKACADCRKSKRRCIHDEFGRQDPVKMAQAAQPRPAAKKKRPSDAANEMPSAKKPKKTPSKHGLYSSDAPDEAFLAAPVAPMAPMMSGVAVFGQQPTPVMPSENLSQTGDEMDLTVGSNGMEVRPGLTGIPSAMPNDTSALVSPPESAHTDNERTASPAHTPRPTVEAAEEGEKGRDLTPPTTASAPRSRRSSQLPAKAVVKKTPDGDRSRAVSIASSDSKVLDAMINKRRASSHTVNEVDEETLKVIKDLAAQDQGLRRRGSRPA